MLTNEEFGDRIGVSHSMASRIRGGQRLPGRGKLLAISREFDIPLDTLHEACEKGPREFGILIRQTLASLPDKNAA